MQRVAQQLLVELLLVGRHGGVQDDLHLARQTGLDLGLHPPQHERLQDVVKLRHHLRPDGGGEHHGMHTP